MELNAEIKPKKYDVYLLNTSIVTSYGTYEYKEISLDEIKVLIKYAHKVNSVIGHQSTADILTELLGQNIEVNRINYSQSKEDIAIVFKLNQRGEEGKIYSREEIEKIGYKFEILQKVS